MDQQSTFNIIKSLRFFSVCLLLLVASNVFAFNHFPLPENHQSTYSVIKYSTEVGEIKNNFQYHDQHINYTSKATTKGAAAFFLKEDITETSHLYWPGDDTLKAPQQTSYTLHHTRKKKKDQEISFIWPNTNHVDISSSYRKKQISLSSNENVWSSQLLPILMSSRLLHDNIIKSDRFLIANKNSLKHYNFTLQSHESIKLNGKAYPCLKFKIVKENSKRFTYAWLSSSHSYLPLKLEQYKGDKLDVSMILKQFKRLK